MRQREDAEKQELTEQQPFKIKHCCHDEMPQESH